MPNDDIIKKNKKLYVHSMDERKIKNLIEWRLESTKSIGAIRNKWRFNIEHY